VIKVDERKFFTGSTTPRSDPKSFVTRMLTRDLFAVANLVVVGHCRLMELLTLLKDAVGHALVINRPRCCTARSQ